MQQLSPVMSPVPGERRRRFAGDRERFTLRDAAGRPVPEGWAARVRTNLGRAAILRQEIIQAHVQGPPPAGAAWRDLPMHRQGNEWFLELPLAEVGYFKAKAYALDPKGWQHWPEGPDVGISVHPNCYRTGNTIYCAFPRLFGPNKTALNVKDERLESQFKQLDQQGYTIIPPSGKLRDLIGHLTHIVETLGCRILHLLPISPTPTTYGRFGRFGSPYASLDLTAIDPALVVFDKRTTGVDQFRELACETHARDARLFLDLAINHTGWSSTLQENHPEWFLRRPDGEFVSPSAWGNTWADLVEMKHDNVSLWDELAEVFLIWCRRGVDGFRCDAGYKVPLPAWQYIIARVQQEFPETIFLLEGLGGAWEATEALLTEGGMQWAYSELFQNYSSRDVAGYLDYALRQCERVGLYVHYSETHDNNRLAAKGRAWSLLRNRLCALASVSGGFGFTCGVEWLATEKINVHATSGLAWRNKDNLVAELGQLNRLLAEHPAFFDGAKLTRVSPADSPVYALRRDSAEGRDSVLVLVNTDLERENSIAIPKSATSINHEHATEAGVANRKLAVDLLNQPLPKSAATADDKITFTLAPGACHCLASAPTPLGLGGDAYRRARAQSACALGAITKLVPAEKFDGCDWHWLAEQFEFSPRNFLAAASALDCHNATAELPALIGKSERGEIFPQVIVWDMLDRRRVTVVPPRHWLLVQDTAPFRATLHFENGSVSQHVESIPVCDGHVACFAPRTASGDATLSLERYAVADRWLEAAVRFVSETPAFPTSFNHPSADALVLLTNGIGGMARLCVDLGHVKSKYDCVLAANLHPAVPVDRHVFVKRIRVWVNADGFITPLDAKNLATFAPGPPAVWRFIANAGDARKVEIQLVAGMLEGCNTTVFQLSRLSAEQAAGKQLPSRAVGLPPDADVRLTVRLDIEDRNFHWETKRNVGADHHFSTYTKPMANKAGFSFTPANDRQLRAFSSANLYNPQPEWSEDVAHAVEQSRGLIGSGDAYSPGWFDLPLPKGAKVSVVVTADVTDPAPAEWQIGNRKSEIGNSKDSFGQQLQRAARAFVVRRNSRKTVIAGYPWFLDWGRDTLICARGLLTAGMADEVRQLLIAFARLEENGTLPNAMSGETSANRDTSDAPLWFGIACEEAAAVLGESFYQTETGKGAQTIAEVLRDIAVNYAEGTPNGIRMDTDSALIWSPAHFTWMDTSFPACTPREGYPIEVQALWIRLLRQLERNGGRTGSKGLDGLADRALASLERIYWIEDRGYFADVLIANANQPASKAVPDDALRSNFLLAISLGLVAGNHARRAVEAALRYLVVPGAVRSLAPLPVSVPLPIHGQDGRPLNNPAEPYWGRYEGDENTRRKPAYHNGTAWTWTLPVFCEAMARAWDFVPEAVAAACAYLGSVDRLMAEGCLGHIPEIVDGDAPHIQRGCDAQAWSVTEALRVWKLLNPQA
jgi:predicted glycogen debranching enzyme